MKSRHAATAARRLAMCLLLLSCADGRVSAESEALVVESAGPQGALSERDEANEIRIVFSRPMVTLGRVPDVVAAPFVRLSPPAAGTFRWSGTRTLIFTPAAPLPWATRYDVEVAAGTASVSGQRLAEPRRFSFTTPTLRLSRVEWYRRGGRYDAPLVIGLRFNQPVDPETLAAHVALRYLPHEWTAPSLSTQVRSRLAEIDAAAPADFDAKLAATRAATQRHGFLAAQRTEEWNAEQIAPGDDLLVLQTTTAPPTDVWLAVRVGPAARGAEGSEATGQELSETLKLEATLFASGFRCALECDPDDYNPLRFRSRVSVAAVMGALEVRDVTRPDAPHTLTTRAPTPDDATPAPYDYWGDEYARSSALPLDRAGISTLPGRRYEVVVRRDLASLDGQTLGYTWLGDVDNWHRSAFSSFGSGHGLWEASGGADLPFYTRNLESVMGWARALGVDELMPTLLRLNAASDRLAPGVEPVPIPLSPSPDLIESRALPLAPALSAEGRGLVFAALQDGPPIPRARGSQSAKPRAGLIQVTDLGVSVKDSPQGSLVLVARLTDGQPVAGARVSFRNRANEVLWSGETDADGLALAPPLPLREPSEGWWETRFVVTAEKDGDVAYVLSDWTEGVEPWAFGLSYDLDESLPVLRGRVFVDRGVYRPGEEARLKAVLRTDTPDGIHLLPPGTEVSVSLTDNQGNEIETRKLRLSGWSSAEWSVTLPRQSSLGRYAITATVAGQRGSADGDFLVAAYRRPDFRVDARLDSDGPLAGARLSGQLEARYLFGAPMPGLPAHWTLTAEPLDDVPPAISERFPRERYAFLREDWYSQDDPGPRSIGSGEATLDAVGALAMDFDAEAGGGVPWRYTFEGEVTDLSRQAIAGRASLRVEAASFYLALRRPGYFSAANDGLRTELAAVGLDGVPVAGVEVSARLLRMQWHSAQRAEGGGFYSWDSERREVDAGSWTLTTAAEPVALEAPLGEGGSYVLRLSARDAEGRETVTTTSFYVLGEGYTAWERYDHNRIDVVPERTTYRPGDTARLLVRSPWERATALLTTEREGIRSHRVIHLESTQHTFEVPIGEREVPNVYVSVLLVKGRTQPQGPDDGSDPGKPAFRLGYAELKVDDPGRRLDVEVTTDREAYRPADRARVNVRVRDHAGAGVASEVTLWAVDHGVLSLTGYQAPELVGSVYVDKALQVLNLDSRQRLISRRATIPKGGDEGGDGGGVAGPGTPVRKDFRVLAFWIGALHTDATGNASVEVELPEDLSTYRIMAVAADRDSRFGRSAHEIRIDKPLLLSAAFPRFLTPGDRAHFGAVLHSQLAQAGRARVRFESLDPERLEIVGEAEKQVQLAARGSAEVRFEVVARAAGPARIRMSVALLDESDAFEQTLSVRVLVSPETVAAHGRTDAEATETLSLPEGVLPDVGGLRFELASSALVGLAEGARYLVDYPYGCAEQRASSTLALLLAADLGGAFRIGDLDPERLGGAARTALDELSDFQCEGGGFAYWPGRCEFVSAYLSAYLLHVLQTAASLGHAVEAATLARGYDYLEQTLPETPPQRLHQRGSWLAGQVFAARVLARGGRNVDSHLTRLHGEAEHMPRFALADLHDALRARAAADPRLPDLQRRLTNAILPEGGSAHVEEIDDPELAWLWSSTVRTTATTLSSLVRAEAAVSLQPLMVRWLLDARQRGRWGNTQDNARALEALVDYYRAHERVEPDFEATLALGVHELLQAAFRGRSAEAVQGTLPMRAVLAQAAAGEELPLRFAKQGPGTLHYGARLTYAPVLPSDDGLDAGFEIERRYAPARPEDAAASTRFRAGDLVRVSLRLRLTKERRFVAVTDPLPAGFEPVESWFQTTAADLARAQREAEQGGDWHQWWERGGFDHVERHDDRVQLFATRLAEGEHDFSYVVRATTAGRFGVGPARAEEMYAPEVFGRTGATTIEVDP